MIADLEQYGPRARPSKPVGLAVARRYCRRLARRHYENFTVASLLLPRGLRQHFYNVYAYCRWADDLADETDDPRESLALLDWWEEQLRLCYAGTAAHPVFVALGETIRQFDIPVDPFLDLLAAFRQDQRVVRYETFEELLDYCRYSACPVGRLVLYLGRCCTEDRVRLSDSICTGLQLANFYQDVARDYDRGRIYIPQADCRRFGYDESNFAGREHNEAFRLLMASKVEQAEGFFSEGLPLVDKMPQALRFDVALFIHGGLAILDAVRRQDYNVWARRPKVSKTEKLLLAIKCRLRLCNVLTSTAAKPQAADSP